MTKEKDSVEPTLITLRVTPDFKQLVQEHAIREGKSVSEIVRELLADEVSLPDQEKESK